MRGEAERTLFRIGYGRCSNYRRVASSQGSTHDVCSDTYPYIRAIRFAAVPLNPFLHLVSCHKIKNPDFQAQNGRHPFSRLYEDRNAVHTYPSPGHTQGELRASTLRSPSCGRMCLRCSVALFKIRETLRTTFKSGKTLDLAYRKTQLIQLAYLLQVRICSGTPIHRGLLKWRC